MILVLVLAVVLTVAGVYMLGREVGEVRATARARKRAELLEAQHKDERIQYFHRGYERGWNNGHGWGWRALRQLIEEQGTHVCDGECRLHPENGQRGSPTPTGGLS